MVEDVFVVRKHPVREPVVAHELPDVLGRVQFRRAGRQLHEGDVVRNVEFRRAVPVGLVEKDDDVGALIDLRTDQRQMLANGVGVRPGHDEAGALAFRRTDCAEDIRPFGALILGRGGSGATSGPASGDFVLLADPRFVLPPDLNLYARVEARLDLRQLGGEGF